MKVPSKALIKYCAIICTAFQGFALYMGQEFNPMAYCGAIMTLFGANSVHENVKQYLDKGDLR